jgi:hypothetical protein
LWYIITSIMACEGDAFAAEKHTFAMWQSQSSLWTWGTSFSSNACSFEMGVEGGESGKLRSGKERETGSGVEEGGEREAGEGRKGRVGGMEGEGPKRRLGDGVAELLLLLLLLQSLYRMSHPVCGGPAEGLLQTGDGLVTENCALVALSIFKACRLRSNSCSSPKPSCFVV